VDREFSHFFAAKKIHSTTYRIMLYSSDFLYTNDHRKAMFSVMCRVCQQQQQLMTHNCFIPWSMYVAENTHTHTHMNTRFILNILILWTYLLGQLHKEEHIWTPTTSGATRIWCQEGHMQKLLGFYRRQLSTVAVRLCIGQSALKQKLNCCKSRGARAPVPHSWRRQC